MANYHSDEWIMEKLQYHYEEAQKIVPKEQIMGIFAVGSMNHGLDCENSDVDSKCIVVPSFDDICANRSPYNTPHFISTTGECIEFIDIRIYMQYLMQHSLTRVEILFSHYYIINDIYLDAVQELINSREQIATYNISNILWEIYNQMKKYHKLFYSHHPIHAPIHTTYGYLPKYLYQIVRLEEFRNNILNDDINYQESLQSNKYEELNNIKKYINVIPQQEAEQIAQQIIADSFGIYKNVKKRTGAIPNSENTIASQINSILHQIVKKAITVSLGL